MIKRGSSQKVAEDNTYHSVNDEYQSDWDLSGAAEDILLYLNVAWRLANESGFPKWNEGSEFKATREADLNSSR